MSDSKKMVARLFTTEFIHDQLNYYKVSQEEREMIRLIVLFSHIRYKKSLIIF